MKILVSACLLGTPCRYDGQSKPNAEVMALAERHTLIPICPEVMGGLSIPRPPAERQGARLVNREGIDVTEQYEKGAEAALKVACEHHCRYAILKERSPACGNRFIYDGSFSGILTEGQGVAAALLAAHGITVLGESQLSSLPENEN